MISTVSFERLLNVVVGLFFQLYELGLGLFNFFTQPIAISLGTGFITKILPLPESVIESVTAIFGDTSLLSLMLGVGIFAYLGYQFCSWVLNLFT